MARESTPVGARQRVGQILVAENLLERDAQVLRARLGGVLRLGVVVDAAGVLEVAHFVDHEDVARREHAEVVAILFFLSTRISIWGFSFST